MDTATFSAPRRSIVAAMLAHVPSDTGDGRFEEVIGDMYTGAGTCGFLASFALSAGGICDPRILNRPETETGATYHLGENISRLVGGAKQLGAWIEWSSTPPYGPSPGDILFLSGGKDENGNFLEHVCVFQSEERDGSGGVHWVTWDAGVTNAHGQQSAAERTREVDGRELVRNGLRRKLEGFVDIDLAVIACQQAGTYIDRGWPTPYADQLSSAAPLLLTIATLGGLAIAGAHYL
jgi:hypothetical protein